MANFCFSESETSRMKFSATTEYSLERLVRFSRFTSIKKKWVWIFIAVCTAIVGLTFTLQFTLLGFDATLTWAFVGILLIDALYVFLCFVFPKIALKKSPALGAGVRYEFYDDGYKIDTELRTGKESSELSYETITKVLSSKKDIYLYISANQAYVVDKNAFTLGTAEDFLNFIELKIEARKFLKSRK